MSFRRTHQTATRLTTFYRSMRTSTSYAPHSPRGGLGTVTLLRFGSWPVSCIKLGGGHPEICVFAGDCFGRYLTVEPSGELAACDKYLGDPGLRFGHAIDPGIHAAYASDALAAARAVHETDLTKLRACPW